MSNVAQLHIIIYGINGSVPQWDISAKHGRGTFCRGPPETAYTSLSIKEVYLRIMCI